MLNGDSWLDASTCKLFMDVTNTHPNSTNPGFKPKVNGAWGFFRRMRILCGGQIIGDIDNYNRLHEMYHMMKPTEKRTNDGIEGFGTNDVLARNAKRTVCFAPMSGLLSQEKYLPIRYAPLQIELEMVSSGAEVVDASGANLSTSF